MAELSPETDDLHAEGAARVLPESIWYEVVAGDTAGWVNSRYVGYAGGVDDATAEVVASLGAIPMAETMVDLGTLVAETVASEDPPSRITIAVAPSVGDLGEITMDVIGLGDDSVLGFRLHVFGQPDGEGFSLRTVERMVLCGRGVSGEICV